MSEQLPVNSKRGGGVLKIEAWENEKGKIVKYSMAYINHLIFSNDNGRVIVQKVLMIPFGLAFSSNEILVTHNTGEFHPVKGLGKSYCGPGKRCSE